jgi:hypothetical protein
MVKKGVSAEDKRDRMLKLIRESNTCWLIKARPSPSRL